MAHYEPFHNVALQNGEYIGCAKGVWRITRCTSHLGKWVARHRDNPQFPPLYAFRLADISYKLREFVK